MSLLRLDIPDRTSLLESFLELDQTILDALPIGVYACDVDGHILCVNRALGPSPSPSRSHSAVLWLVPGREPGG
jgi:hypothetical protein